MEKYQIEMEGTEYYGYVCLWEPENFKENYVVTEYVYAPGHGVEIMMKVFEKIQSISNEINKPIIHYYNATNEASLNLIQDKLKHFEYTYTGDKIVEGETWKIFRKNYYPSS